MRRMSAFEIWLRWGRIVTKPEPIETKFNPWHDPDDGRFTFAGQGNRFGGGAPKSREATPRAASSAGGTSTRSPARPAASRPSATRPTGGGRRVTADKRIQIDASTLLTDKVTGGNTPTEKPIVIIGKRTRNASQQAGGAMDRRTTANIATLHPKVRDPATKFINQVRTELGIRLVVTDAYRTYEQQDALYAKGRTAPGKVVTHARAGFSNHNFGTAIDVFPVLADGRIDPDNDKENIPILKRIARIGIENGFEWGGNWPPDKRDYPHFQMMFGNSMTRMREMYKKAGKNLHNMVF